ncbi:MAG: hypothetical protein JEZ08_22455 [Clostridiales bacterium]|nr:hypothetical protein [Clostridiales bacterium]
MKMNGYCGICSICFEPIKTEDGVTVGEGDKFYHKRCTENKPNSYYYALERIAYELKINKKNPTELMDEMELIYKIPALNDIDFNEEHPKVISLYRKLANARDAYLDPKLFDGHNANEYSLDQILSYMKNHAVSNHTDSTTIECDACNRQGMSVYRNEEVFFSVDGFKDTLDESDNEEDFEIVDFAVYKCWHCLKWCTYIE